MRLLSFAFLVVVGCSVAQAAPESSGGAKGREYMKQHCGGDYINFCGDMTQDDPRLNDCFKSNKKKLTENCRRSIEFYYAEQGKKW